MDVTPKRGMRFLYAHQITKDSTARNPVPEECMVTKVTSLAVYYRNSTGFLSSSARGRFPAVVKEWIAAPDPSETGTTIKAVAAEPDAKEAQ